MEKMEDAENESSTSRTENDTIRRWVDVASNNGWGCRIIIIICIFIG